MTDANFTLTSPNGKPVVYITTDPSRNRLLLTLSIDASSPLTLRGGPPVPEPDITSSGPAALYLSFGTLLKRDEFEHIRIEAEGWAAALFSKGIVNWAISPVQNVEVGPGFSVTFTISNILSAGPPAPGHLTIDYFNLGSIPDLSVQKQVFLINPPSGPMDLSLDKNWVGDNTVYVSTPSSGPISNKLVFYLSNPSPTTPLVTEPWGPNPPVFFVSFVYGEEPGYGALTTAESAANIEFGIEDSRDRWTVTPSLQQDPYWQLNPLSPEVLGTGDAATVEFSISSIVTYLQPGITEMYIQYANLPGYNDGYFALEIPKAAPTQITSLTVTPSKFVPAGSEVEVAWTTINATSLSLSYGSRSFGVTDRSSWPLTVGSPDYVTLTAYGENSQTVPAQVPVSPVYAQSTLVRPDEVERLAISPSGDLVAGYRTWGGPFKIRILRTPENAWAENSIVFPGSNNLTVTLSADSQILYAFSDLRYAAFSTGSLNEAMGVSAPQGSTPAACLLSPDQTRLYVLNGSNITALDASTLQTMGTIPVPPGGINMAINAGGSALYVFSRGGDLSLVDLPSQTVTTKHFLAAPGLALDQTLGVLCLVSVKDYDEYEVLFVDAAHLASLGVAVLRSTSIQKYTVVSVLADSTRGYCYAVLQYNPPLATSASIAVIDIAKQQVVASLPLAGNPGAAVLSTDGTHLFGQEAVPGIGLQILHIDFTWIEELAKDRAPSVSNRN